MYRPKSRGPQMFGYPKWREASNPKTYTPYNSMGVSQNYGYLCGGSYNKRYSILESMLGSRYFGKLPYHDQ